MTDYYVGRLATDGYGNLLADEGANAGEPVAYTKEGYVFLNPGDKSHNEQFHKQYVQVEGTNDETAGSPESPTAGQEHHWGVTEDDAHYSATAANKTQLRFDPDKLAARVTSHTGAYTNNG